MLSLVALVFTSLLAGFAAAQSPTTNFSDTDIQRIVGETTQTERSAYFHVKTHGVQARLPPVVFYVVVEWAGEIAIQPMVIVLPRMRVIARVRKPATLPTYAQRLIRRMLRQLKQLRALQWHLLQPKQAQLDQAALPAALPAAQQVPRQHQALPSALGKITAWGSWLLD
ncbi:MAG: hypothetical protein Q9187_003776 [Circinaria calcarea]